MKQNHAEFLNAFYQYVEYHEQALQIFQHETNEMFSELAFAVTATHHKEIEEKKSRLENEVKERETIVGTEDNIRKSIEEERERFTQLNTTIYDLLRQAKDAKTKEQRKQIEDQIGKKDKHLKR